MNRNSVAIANRFAAAILGGYFFAHGFVALAALATFGMGAPYFEAQSLAWMLGILVYLCVLLWGFVPRQTGLVWGVLAGSGLAMSVAAPAML